MTMQKCSVIVPVYNEEKTISKVVAELMTLKKSVNIEVIVVESNSKDATLNILKELKAKNDFNLIIQKIASGKGNAVIEGLSQADGEFVAIVDGDNEYSIGDLKSLIQPLLRDEADLVLGSRHIKGSKMRVFKNHPIRTAYFNFGHVLFTAFFNILYGTKLYDPATMWKVFRKNLIQDYSFTGQRFEFDWEILALLIRRGAVVKELPASYTSRTKEEGKKIRPIKDPALWVFWIITYRFRKITNYERGLN